jgi:hypothetical protein
MVEIDQPTLPARWVYFETKRVRRALPTDVLIEYSRAVDVVSAAAETTRTLDAIERSSDAPQNVNACEDYGGCSYHVSKGGPCDARRSVGKLISLRLKGKKSMALTEEQKAKFAKFGKKDGATPPADAETPPADGGGETPPAAPPAKPAKPRAKAPSPTAGSKAAQVAALSTRLTAAEAAAEAANADVAKIVDELAAVIGR